MLFYLDELKKDRETQLYGIFLSLIFLISPIYYFQREYAVLLSSSEAICWPFFSHCHELRFIKKETWELIFVFIIGLSLINSFLFWKGKYAKSATLVLAAQLLLFCLIVAMDFRTQLNQNQIIFYIVLGFLVLPKKLESIPWIIVSCYFWAGLLKLNSDWIDGFSLGREFLQLPSGVKFISTRFAVLLEIVLIWGLLFRNRLIVFSVLACLFVFHAFSVWIVGFYYPILMGLVLSIFILRSQNMASLVWPNKTTIGFIIVIALLNIWPKTLPGDRSVTGEGRIYSFHMFDANVECEAFALVKFKTLPSKKLELRIPTQNRIRCDPILYLGRINSLCRKFNADPDFVDMDLTLSAKKRSHADYQVLVDEINLCTNPLEYNLFSTNKWIRK